MTFQPCGLPIGFVMADVGW